MKTKPKPSETARLEAAAEVVAYAHWRLAELMAGGDASDKATRTETDWLMGMLGSAAADLLALSFPARACPDKPLNPRRSARRSESQAALDLVPVQRLRLVYSREDERASLRPGTDR